MKYYLDLGNSIRFRIEIVFRIRGSKTCSWNTISIWEILSRFEKYYLDLRNIYYFNLGSAISNSRLENMTVIYSLDLGNSKSNLMLENITVKYSFDLGNTVSNMKLENITLKYSLDLGNIFSKSNLKNTLMRCYLDLGNTIPNLRCENYVHGILSRFRKCLFDLRNIISNSRVENMIVKYSLDLDNTISNWEIMFQNGYTKTRSWNTISVSEILFQIRAWKTWVTWSSNTI